VCRPWPSYGRARCRSMRMWRPAARWSSRPDCPSCAGPLVFWSGYRRYVRAASRCQKIFVPRVRCGRCRVTHVLLPAFALVGRLDVAETVGGSYSASVSGLLVILRVVWSGWLEPRG
jgi:hypothetical protein